jgi:KaiC/GvpD/RAD55 family RecA-like ATPase
MDVLEKLSENKTTLLIIPSEEYNSFIVGIAKQVSKNKVIYVTLNKTYESLKEIFNKKGVNTEKMFFIDAISKTIKKTPDQTPDCYFINSPGALTDLSLIISKLLDEPFDYLLFDSLTNLTIYEKKTPVAKFLAGLVNKIEESKIRALFYALNVGQQDELIKECEMFVDEVVDLSKTI